MNLKDKHHGIYLNYETSYKLKALGLPQDKAGAYWFRNDKKVYASERINKFRGWEKLYIAAVTGEELNRYLPVNTEIKKTGSQLYQVSLPLEKLSASGSTEGEAKAAFLKVLIKSGLTKI